MSKTCLQSEARQNRILLEIYPIIRELAAGRTHEEDFEDLAHDVTLKILTKLRAGTWKRPRNMRKYLLTLILDRRIELYRSEEAADVRALEYVRHQRQNKPEWMLTDSMLTERGMLNFCADVLKKKSRKCRFAYHMVRIEGNTYGEAAARLKVSPHTVHNYIVTAQRAIRLELEALGVIQAGARTTAHRRRSRLRNTEEAFAPGYVAQMEAEPV